MSDYQFTKEAAAADRRAVYLRTLLYLVPVAVLLYIAAH